MDNIRTTVTENLKNVAHAPSVQMQDVGPDFAGFEMKNELDPDVRNHQDEIDRR